MDTSRKSAYGFTIIELLIVVVVIAILATISVVAYSGIQNRAQLAKASSAMNEFHKLLNFYYAEHGVFPNPGASIYACVGTAADYPAAPGFAAGQCDNYPGYPVHVSTQLATALAPYSSRIPNGSLPPQPWNINNPGLGYNRGVYYTYWGPQEAEIQFTVSGSHACPQGESYPVNNGTGTTCYMHLSH